MINQNSFAAGELAPALWSRFDLAKYKSGARTLKNFIPLPYGGIINKPGTTFIADLGGNGRLIPFEFNTEQAYVLVFTDDLMRIVKDGGLVVYPVGHPYDGDVVEVVSPYAVEDLPLIRYVQSADTLFLTHPDYAPRSLTRTDHHEWTFTTLAFEPEIGPPATVGAAPEEAPQVTYEYFVGVRDNSNRMYPRMLADVGQWIPFDATEEALVAARIFQVPNVPLSWDGDVTVTIAERGDPFPSSEAQGVTLFRRLQGDTKWDAVKTRARVAVTITPTTYRLPPSITDTNTTASAWTTTAKGTDGAGLAEACIGSHGGAAKRTYEYRVSSLGGGEESYPTGAVGSSQDNPWTVGLTSTVVWTPVLGAESYNVYKNSRGSWGWVGRIDIPEEFQAKQSPAFSGLTTMPLFFAAPEHGFGVGDEVEYFADPDVFISGDFASGRYVVDTVPTADSFSLVDIDVVGPGTVSYTTPKAFFVKAGGPRRVFIDDNIEPDVTFGYRTPPLDDFTVNYPTAVALFEQRLFFGGSSASPTDVYASRTGSLLDFSVSNPLRSDDPLTARPATGKVDAILHMVPGPSGGLVLFTAGAEILFEGQGGVAINNVGFDIQGYDGCAEYPAPIAASKSILFAQRDGRVVRDLSFTYEVEGYRGNDVTVLANHVFADSPMVDWAHQQSPYGIVWCVRADGDIRAFTFLKEHVVPAWSSHDTDGSYRAVASIPGPSQDEVYFIVERTGGFYLERLTEWSIDGVFLDSSLAYDGAPADEFTGLGHLEGETVSVVADGDLYEGLVVTAGEITLPAEHSVVVIGLPYTSELETLDLDADGQAQGKKQRLVSVTTRYQSTKGGIFVGPNSTNVFEQPFRTFEGYDEPTALFTGDKKTPVTSIWGDSARVYLKQTQPFPVTVLALLAELDVGR